MNTVSIYRASEALNLSPKRVEKVLKGYGIRPEIHEVNKRRPDGSYKVVRVRMYPRQSVIDVFGTSRGKI
jgi:hypothetical protein